MDSAAAPAVSRETAFDEVFDSQKTFRVLLEAMSRPGRVCGLPRPLYRGTPAGLNPSVLTVLKTLCDHRVSFAVAGPEERTAWVQHLAVNTVAPPAVPESADFVVFDGSTYADAFARLKRGEPEFPERSATAVITVKQLETAAPAGPSEGCLLLLSGPGVSGSVRLAAAGLDRRYMEELILANAILPLGVDVVLLDAAGMVSCIPRSTAVKVL
jgi:alpha-D-ribose 1-methylphosphonate 5-triphosphate synthase subunit PhnH